MIIRNDQEDFDTDELLLVDRSEDKATVIAVLESKTIAFRGIAAQQVWAAVTEQATTVKEL